MWWSLNWDIVTGNYWWAISGHFPNLFYKIFIFNEYLTCCLVRSLVQIYISGRGTFTVKVVHNKWKKVSEKFKRTKAILGGPGMEHFTKIQHRSYLRWINVKNKTIVFIKKSYEYCSEFIEIRSLDNQDILQGKNPRGRKLSGYSSSGTSWSFLKLKPFSWVNGFYSEL